MNKLQKLLNQAVDLDSMKQFAHWVEENREESDNIIFSLNEDERHSLSKSMFRLAERVSCMVELQTKV